MNLYFCKICGNAYPRSGKCPRCGYEMSLLKANIGEKPSKMHNKKTECDGFLFDSAAEAHRYQDLKLMEKAGSITHLELQPSFNITINNKHVCDYFADFRYFDVDMGEDVVEDVKGFRTKEFILKKKLVKAIYNIDVKEVKA